MAYLTYFDVVEHLIAASFGGPQDAEQRDIRTAAHRCYTELSNIRDWSWQHAHGRVITSAPETGAVGSYSSGTLTLSNGLTGTGFSHVKIGNIVSRIASRTSSTVYVLDDLVQFPSATNGDICTFYKTTYELPADFRNLDEPSDEFNWWSGSYVTPDEAMKMERVNFQSGTPLHWTVIKDPTSSGWVLKLVGYPTVVETVDFTYRRSLRPLRWSGHEASARVGTVSVSAGAVTGSGTSFADSMAGSVIRLGTAADLPGPLTSITPYEAESAIADSSITSTSLTASDSLPSSAGVKYLITDPIDLPGHMHNVMLSGAEYWLARIRSNNVEEKYQLYQRDLRLAMEADQLAPISGRSKRIWHDGGWRAPLLADNFDFSN
jgi:hypothetical protein